MAQSQRFAEDDEARRLIATYPRPRLPLEPEYERIYVDHYKRNRSTTGGLSKVVMGLEAWMHRQVASRQSTGAVLELGAGTLNHLQYENSPSAYDAIEPFRALWETNSHRSSLRAIYSDIEEIPSGMIYDKVFSIAVLEHLTDLPRTMARCALLLAPGGVFQAGIPSEGGLLWGLSWRLTTGVSFRLTRGLDYSRIMQHEHVNQSSEIELLASHFFEVLTIRRFPLPWRHLSFYTYLEASAPRIGNCREALASRLSGQSKV